MNNYIMLTLNILLCVCVCVCVSARARLRPIFLYIPSSYSFVLVYAIPVSKSVRQQTNLLLLQSSDWNVNIYQTTQGFVFQVNSYPQWQSTVMDYFLMCLQQPIARGQRCKAAPMKYQYIAAASSGFS